MVHHTNVKQSTRFFKRSVIAFILPIIGVFVHSMVMYDRRTALRMLPPKCALSTARLLSDLSHQPEKPVLLSPLQQYSKLSPKVPHSANPTKTVYKRIYILIATDGVLPVMPALQPFVQFNGSRSHFFTAGRQRGEQSVQIIFPALPFRFGNKFLIVRYLVYQFVVARGGKHYQTKVSIYPYFSKGSPPESGLSATLIIH